MSAAANLMERLGLTDEELCAVRTEAAEAVGPESLRRWVRTSGPRGRPLDLLLARDFAGFEDAVGELEARGFVVRAHGSTS